MKNLYLVLAIIGFIAPNIFVLQESIATGNWFFWMDPSATLEGMFPNRIATAFMVDLLFVVLVFFIWSYFDAKKRKIKHLGWVWLATLLLGLAGAFPLYLYLREGSSKKNTQY